jgi:hypothetical protein
MRPSLIALSTVAATFAAASGVEDITVFGSVDHDYVQAVYDGLGGTFSLSGSNGSGLENAHLSAIFFDRDIMETFYNKTWEPATAAMGISRRAPTFSVPQCEAQDSGGSFLLSSSQQQDLLNLICPYMGQKAVIGASFVGYTVAKGACGQYWRDECTLVITMGPPVAGYYIGPLIQQNCAATYEAIQYGCGERGGTINVRPEGAPSSFNAEMYATDVDASGACPAGLSGYDCQTLTCSNGCKDGSAPTGGP